MNNEPVFWLLERENGEHSFIKNKTMQEHYKSKNVDLIPLYTHPAKTLTDEEITDIAKEHIHQRLEGERFGYVEFARAILRKAQENDRV